MNDAQALFAKVYEQAQGAAGASTAGQQSQDAGNASTNGATGNDDVVDGDYREV